MSGTFALAPGQVFTGGNVVGPGVTGMVALSTAGTLAFNMTGTSPQISGTTITQDAAASSLLVNGAIVESVTIDTITQNEQFELTSNIFSAGTYFPPGFHLPEVVQGWGLSLTIQTDQGTFFGQAGLFGVNGPLAYVVLFTISNGFETLPFYQGAIFSNGAQLTGNVANSFPADFSPPCFAQGTSIATESGTVPVEQLVAGDSVRLADGGIASVVWLGRRHVECYLHARPQDVLPVRVIAHAFGMDRPQRDLVLSPDHAVFADGVLVPIRYLINGATVLQEDVASVTYWHVELPVHCVLLAEGMPAESYLDTGNRAAFANGGSVVMAHPDFARAVWQREGCAPLVTEGPIRDLVYRRLIAQALSLGWRAENIWGDEVRWLPPVTKTGADVSADGLPARITAAL